MEAFEIVGLVLSVIGVVGLTTFVALVRRGRSWMRRHRVLRFTLDAPVDLVLGTSAVIRKSEPHGYQRLLTSLGNLRAASAFSEAVGELRAKKPVRLWYSDGAGYRLDDDIVLVGGPRRSQPAAEFLEYLGAAHPELNLDVQDVAPEVCHLTVADLSIDYTPDHQEAHPEYPATDYALVVAWINPFASELRRGFLCAGFTSHGTAAASEYFLRDYVGHRYAPPAGVGPLGRFRDWPCFVLVLRVVLAGDVATDVKELKCVRLERPVVPLASTTARKGASGAAAVGHSAGLPRALR